MNKKPFQFSGGTDVLKPKAFDGSKTTSNSGFDGGFGKKPFELGTMKFGSVTDTKGRMFAGKEKALEKEIEELDWELKSGVSNSKPRGYESEAVIKKKDFNNTGETKATYGTIVKQEDDWDIDDREVWRKAPRLFNGINNVSKKKEKDDEDNEWNIKDVVHKKKVPITTSNTKMSHIKIEEKKK